MSSQESAKFQILNLKWSEMEMTFVIATWILVTCLCKIVFTKLKQYVNIIPESALQIFFGFLLVPIFYYLSIDRKLFGFEAHTFFVVLLPPIIFDAGYFMPNREFFDNFSVIMIFAVVATTFNVFAIGFSLASLNNAFNIFSLSPSTSECLLFASLISAVDPVAVLAVFEEMHVNKPLFVTVFGEALFNDAISVVIFGIMKSFCLASDGVSFVDYGMGIITFFVVSFGGVLIGLLTSIFCSIATKFTQNTPVISSLLVLVIAYLGYVISEILSFSSIIAAAVCGMSVKQFIKFNVNSASFETIGVMTRSLAISSESLTFILLGLATISTKQHWDLPFVSLTIVFCLVYRFIAILGLAWIIKLFGGKQIKMKDQIVLCLGGLRGAIAFGSVLSMPDAIKGKNMFVSATLAVIFFTVIIQGTMMRPLLNFLNVETDETSFTELNLEQMEIDQPHPQPKSKWFGFRDKYLIKLLTRKSE